MILGKGKKLIDPRELIAHICLNLIMFTSVNWKICIVEKLHFTVKGKQVYTVQTFIIYVQVVASYKRSMWGFQFF